MLHPAVLYCALLGGPLLGIISLLRFGVAPALAMPLIIVAAVGAIIFAEWRLRLDPAIGRWTPDTRTDLCHLIVNSAIPQGFALLLATLTIALIPDGGIWPARWPLEAQVVLAIGLSELGVYAMHRACHHRAFLWRFHRVHHTSTGLYWLNQVRFHPLDLLWMHAIAIGPVVLLGAPPATVAVLAVFGQIGAFLQHANLRGDFGRLSAVFNTPDLHRWHHSTVPTEANHNFGGTLVVWDRLFGTWRKPAGAPDRLGVEGFAPTRYRDQLIAPLFRDRPTKEHP